MITLKEYVLRNVQQIFTNLCDYWDYEFDSDSEFYNQLKKV